MNCIVNAWESNRAELRSFLIRHLGDVARAEDLLQEVFIKALTEGAGFCKLENSRAWLFKVAKNRMIDSFRRKNNMEYFDENMLFENSKIEAIQGLSTCLPRALQVLNDDERSIITLCDLEGMKQADYAEYKNISLTATKSRIQRARRELKNQLQKNCQINYDESGNVCCFVPASGK